MRALRKSRKRNPYGSASRRRRKSFISEALKVGADAFVTGASGYNAALEAADRELAVIDAGHYHTEFLPLVQRMTSLISSAFADVSVAVSGAGCEISCF